MEYKGLAGFFFWISFSIICLLAFRHSRNDGFLCDMHVIFLFDTIWYSGWVSSEKQNLSHKMKIVCQVLTNVLGKSLVFSFTKWLTNKFFVEKPRKLVAFGTVYQSQLPTLSGKLYSLKTFVLRVSLTNPYNYWILSWYATPELKPFSMLLYSLHLHLDCWVNCLSHNNNIVSQQDHASQCFSRYTADLHQVMVSTGYLPV